MTHADTDCSSNPRHRTTAALQAGIHPSRRRRHGAIGSPLLGANPPQDSDIQLATLVAVGGALELATMWVRGELDITREHLTEFIISAIVTVATDMTRSEHQQPSAP
jgi:hypothetical protein